ncbi:hypothetical protein MUN82_07525 [Hymenobacter aerilatus]|uniref:Uncharacterized protein n=1 Tax=Hymenobacter aerilatus TaxID=2932251 RepID=A0A8T9SXJ8_9BACT|nr:hypothetical protein [Hymenobacter aerilatus]UOR06942.1 hypothetical protein MUN82_07525 [Hymenobacter aerilatus]
MWTKSYRGIPRSAAHVFERLFDHVLAQCVARDLVSGDTQAIDSAPVKANVSLDRLQEKHPLPTTSGPVAAAPLEATPEPPHPSAVLSAPAHHLRQKAARRAHRHVTTSSPLGAQHTQARLVSDKTHDSLTCPEACISVKPGKARALNKTMLLAAVAYKSEKAAETSVPTAPGLGNSPTQACYTASDLPSPTEEEESPTTQSAK